MKDRHHLRRPMHRFLPGLVFLQLLTAVMVAVAGLRGDPAEWWYLGIAAAVSAVVTALWFATIARHRADSAVSDWRLKHSAELHRHSAEVQKAKSDAKADRSQQEAKLHRKLHKEILKAERRAGRRSSMKVTLAFGGVVAMGVLMLLTELFTLGLLTISSAGSALGGYLLHWRQSRAALATARADAMAGPIAGTPAIGNDATRQEPVLTLPRDH